MKTSVKSPAFTSGAPGSRSGAQQQEKRTEQEKGTGYFSRVKGRFKWSEVVF
jgi:hypothetical protein